MDAQKKAISELSKMLKKDPANKQLLCKRAELYLGLEMFEKAIDDFTSVVKLDPKDEASYYKRGRAYDFASDYKNAIKDFTAAIKINPEDSQFFYGRGRCYERLGQFKKAIRDFSFAIELNPKDSSSYYGRALSFEQSGMQLEADKDYKQVEVLNNGNGGSVHNGNGGNGQRGQDHSTRKTKTEAPVYLPVSDPSAGSNRYSVQVLTFPPCSGFEELHWGIGDRVLARWRDLYWYPATILNTQTTVNSKEKLNSVYDYYHVLYEDGSQLMLPSIAVMPLSLTEYKKFFVRPRTEPLMVYPAAKLLKIDGEAIEVEYGDGKVESNRATRARVWHSPLVQQSLPFKENQRVFCWDVEGSIYPAEIISIDGDEVLVHILSGPEKLVTPEFLQDFVVQVGDKVEIRWKGAPAYWPCIIEEKIGDRILVRYEDNSKEWSTVRLLRIPIPKVVI